MARPPDRAASETECELEEIYFQVARDGVGYQRAYASAAGPIDVLVEVRTDDVVLIPHGWHGPSMAAPGYDLYYLNVMAGPGAHLGPREWAEEKVAPASPSRVTSPTHNSRGNRDCRGALELPTMREAG